jgi:hypothetical protein
MIDYALKTNEMYFVKSLCFENVFFLFTDNIEKTVKVDFEYYVTNPKDFKDSEKEFLKNKGLKIRVKNNS